MTRILNHLFRTMLLALVLCIAVAPAEVEAQRSGKRAERSRTEAKRSPSKRAAKSRSVKKERAAKSRSNARNRSVQRNNNRSAKRENNRAVQRNNRSVRPNTGRTVRQNRGRTVNRGNGRSVKRDKGRRVERSNKGRVKPDNRTFDLNNRIPTNGRDVRTRDDRRRGDNDRVRDGNRRRGDNGRVRDGRRGDDDRVRNRRRGNNDRVRNQQRRNRPRANPSYRDRRDDRYRRSDRNNNRRWDRNQRHRFNNRYKYHSRKHRNKWRNRRHRYHYRYNWRRYNRNHYYRRYYHRHGRPAFGFYIHIPSYRYYHNDYHYGRSSRFFYRQSISAHGGYNDYSWDGRYDVRTTIKRKVRHVGHDRVEMEFRIERIDIYDGNYHVGSVRKIPSKLGRMKATLYQDGYVEFDRMAYIVGDPTSGFELISTRYYGGNVLDAYERGHGFRVGVLDFYRERVKNVNHSRHFDPYNFNGVVPVALMPDDDYWGFQYLAGGYGQNGDYYYGNYDYYNDDYADDDGYFYRNNEGNADYGYQGNYPSFKQDGSAPQANVVPRTGRAFTNQGNLEYQTKRGADIRLERQVEIKHLGTED